MLESKRSLSTAGKRSSLAFALCLAFLCVSVSVMILAPLGKPALEYGISPHALMISSPTPDIPNIQGPRRGYTLYLFLVFLLTLVSPFVRARLVPSDGDEKAGAFHRRAGLVPVVVFFFFAFEYYSRLCLDGLVFSILLVSGLWLYYRRSNLRTQRGDFLACTILTLSIAAVPGLLARLDLSGLPSQQLVAIQYHYRCVVGWADRIADGYSSLESLYYGYLPHVLLGLWEKSFGQLSMNAFALMVKFWQITTLISMTVIISVYARRNYLAVAICILGLIPLYHANQLAITFPNLSLGRYLTFALALGFLLVKPDTGRTLSGCWLAGLVAGGLMLLSSEVGLVAAFGIGVYILQMNGYASLSDWKSLCLKAGTCALGTLVTVLVYVLFVKLAFGNWCSIQSFVDNWRLLKVYVDAGFMCLALPLEFYPVFLLVLVHTTYVFIATLLDDPSKSTRRKALRMAACAIILSWLTYYVNRPDPQYLQPVLPVYCLLLTDLVRGLLLGLGRRYPLVEPGILGWLVLLLIWFPFSWHNFKQAIPSYLESVNTLRGIRDHSSVKMCGVYLSRALADELWIKAHALSDFYKESSVLYVSLNNYLLTKLTGHCPEVDAMEDLYTVGAQENLVAKLRSEGPTVILVDSMQSPTKGSPAWEQSLEAFRLILKKTGKYELQEENLSCWEVWRRKNPL